MIAATFEDATYREGRSDARYFIDAIVLAATFVVVAIPEGLPMTVAISLGFRANTILEQNLLIRKVSGNENMGYVTDILPNKTGTFTKNDMVCSAGWFADLYYSTSDGIPNGKKKFENGELIDDEECDLSEYNWSRVNMKILNKIISNYHDVLTDDNVEEIAREIYFDYECEDDHLENINIYIEDLLRDQIKKNS